MMPGAAPATPAAAVNAPAAPAGAAEQERDAARVEADQLRKTVAELREEITTLQATLPAADGEDDGSLLRKLNQLRRVFDSKSKELTAANTAVGKLTVELEHQRKQSSLVGSGGASTPEAKALAQERMDRQAERDRLQKTISDLKTEVTQLQLHRDELQQQLQAVKAGGSASSAATPAGAASITSPAPKFALVASSSGSLTGPAPSPKRGSSELKSAPVMSGVPSTAAASTAPASQPAAAAASGGGVASAVSSKAKAVLRAVPADLHVFVSCSKFFM